MFRQRSKPLAEITTVSNEKWTSGQAYGIAIVCLLLGLAGGWFIRRVQAPAENTQVAATPAAIPNQADAAQASLPAPPPLQQLQPTAETQAAPLLAQLKTDPNNARLLENIGDIYYDAQQYTVAIEYYQRALNVQPSNTSVRTDMATAIWYTGNADVAIAEFKKSLGYEPTNANTLFNLGIVLRQGKHDAAAAVTAWQKLLDSNPRYANKDKVQQMINDAKASANKQ
jgi:cytochrome c-type biogenesis protein CcmH/NrfG